MNEEEQEPTPQLNVPRVYQGIDSVQKESLISEDFKSALIFGLDDKMQS
jgi:hypothetical protein